MMSRWHGWHRRRSGPDQTEKWAERVYALLPRIQLTQLLEEVDGWTHFTKAFTHLYTGQPAPDRTGLLTTVLADATNLGKTRMADATEKYTADRLVWIEDWYIREPNYARAGSGANCGTSSGMMGRCRDSYPPRSCSKVGTSTRRSWWCVFAGISVSN